MSATAQVFETREDWLAARTKRIGGSEVAALFGVEAAYQKSRYALWQEKSGRIASIDTAGSRPEWGLRLEAAIAEGAAAANGWTIEKGGYVDHPTVAGLGCTLDYVITDPGEKRQPFMAGPGVLEIKNVDWLQHKQAWGDEPPAHVLLQLQHQLAATTYAWGAVVCLIGGNQLAEPYFFQRRGKIINEIEKRVAAFWLTVDLKQEPMADGSASTAAAIAALFPESVPDKEIDFGQDNEFAEVFGKFKQARLDRSAAEKAEAAAKNWLTSKIADAEIVKYAGRIVATYKSAARKGYVVEPSVSRTLRLKDI